VQVIRITSSPPYGGSSEIPAGGSFRGIRSVRLSAVFVRDYFMIPFGRTCRAKAKPLRGVLFLFMTFTKQVLFSHSKNKNTRLPVGVLL
jgi:hypothetical protein